MNPFSRLFRRPVTASIPIPPPEPLTPKPLRISESVAEALGAKPPRVSPFVGLPKPPPGVRPSAVPTGMAMDEGGSAGGAWGAWAMQGAWGEGLHFPGYPYLAELAQRPEYRNMAETIAEEMTRKWVKLRAVGGDDKAQAIEKIEAAMKLHDLRAAFNRGAELDGFFGMGLIYIDIKGAENDPDELKKPLLLDEGKIDKGALVAFRPVDPTWVSPSFYNSTDPLAPWFMVPETWFVMGKEVHASRLLIIRSREVPDILKPSYNFGGLSLSQIAKPYVDNWLRTRQSVSDLIHSFSVFVLKTTLSAYLADASQLAKRVSAFILGRDNKGLMLVDKDQEDFANVSASVSGLDGLQAQAQEQLASVTKIPLVKLLGTSPKGLNASSDGEIRVFYDHIHALQERVFGEPLTRALKVIQLSELGAVDDGIGFEFVGLWELDEAGKAAVQKTKADTGAVLMAGGVVSNEEERGRVAQDPESGYHGLEGPPPEPEELDPDDDDDADRIADKGAEGSEAGANSGA